MAQFPVQQFPVQILTLGTPANFSPAPDAITAAQSVEAAESTGTAMQPSSSPPKFSTGGGISNSFKGTFKKNQELRNQSGARRTSVIKVPFSSFPPEVQEQLEKYDVDGDHHLDANEILEGFYALEREQERSKWLQRGLIASIVFTLVLLAAIGGLVYAIVEVTKETGVSSNVLTVKGETTPIQTAAVDFEVKNGVIQSRVSETCAGSACQAGTLGVAQAAMKAPLSSEMADADLQELRSLTISQGDNWVHFQIHAVARYSESALFSRWGSVVVLYTHLGELTLDDVDISFHERLEGAFTRAGFTVDGSGRRLLGLVTLLGSFNKINHLSDDGASTPTPLPKFFKGTFTVIFECWAGVDCHNDATGQLVNWKDAPSKSSQFPTLSWQEEYDYINYQGAYVGRLVAETPRFPEQTVLEVYNNSHRFTGQTYGGNNYYCALEQDEWVSVLQDTTNLGGSMTYEGLVTRNGKECKHFVMVDKDEQVTQIYEAVDLGRIYQIQSDNTIYQLDTLDPYPNVVDEAPPSEYDLGMLFGQCPSNKVAPPLIDLFEKEDTVPVDSSWGTATRRNLEPAKAEGATLLRNPAASAAMAKSRQNLMRLLHRYSPRHVRR